jgi:hypothetical protein
MHPGSTALKIGVENESDFFFRMMFSVESA